MSASSGHVLLRQVIVNHGHCIPPFKAGSARTWLRMLPSSSWTESLDRRSVVLPRPGDGWYAPPSGSGAECVAGFPWGELTERGVEEMVHRGSKLCTPMRGFVMPAWCDPEVLIRAANRPRSIASAQALIVGAVKSHDCGPGQRVTSPAEVLLQQGEHLVPQIVPSSPSYPMLQGKKADEVASLEEAMVGQIPAISDSLKELGFEAQNLANMPIDWDAICEVLVCVEGTGTTLNPALSAKIDAVKRFNYLRWASPLHSHGPEAAAEVIGPLIRDLLQLCEDAIEKKDGAPTLAAYVSQADTLVTLLATLGLAGDLGASEGRAISASGCSWPDFGANLEIALLEDNDEPFVQFKYDGVPLATRLGRDVLPFDIVKSRLMLACSAA